MKGYSLTPKGIFTLTLVCLAFFALLTTSLTLWAGRLAGPPELPDGDASSGVSFEPSQNPPDTTGDFTTPGTIAEPTDEPPTPSGVMPGTGTPSSAPETALPASSDQPSGAPPPATDQPGGSGGLAFPSEERLQLMFPFGQAVMAAQSLADLEAYLADIPGGALSGVQLLLEGRAHAGERGDQDAARALAQARAETVKAVCTLWGFSAESISVFDSFGEEDASEVPGAVLQAYRPQGK
jgi:outer membrane protein OmpA-like peptidoglycan-associated protein